MIRPAKNYMNAAKEEAQMLKFLSQNDPNGIYNFVHLVEEFQYGEYYCLVFEKLGVSLYEFLKINEFLGTFHLILLIK